MFDYTELSASLCEMCTSIDRSCEFLAKMKREIGDDAFSELVLEEMNGRNGRDRG